MEVEEVEVKKEKEAVISHIKMETKYNETEFPRKDNYFRTKNSLSF